MLIDHLSTSSSNFAKTLNSLETLQGYFSAEPGPSRYDYIRWADVAGLAHEMTHSGDSIVHRAQRGEKRSYGAEQAQEATIYAVVYETARPPRLLHNYRWTSKQVISDYLDALMVALEKGQLLNLYSSARSIIEKVSNLQLAQIELDELVKGQELTGDEYMDSVQFLADVSAQIGRSSKQARFNWKSLEKGESIRQKKVRKPEHREGFQEHEQVSTLKAVDKLGKKVFGLRNVYEFLCEFVHPNFGHTFLHVKEDGGKRIRHNLMYRTRISNSAAPSESWRVMAPSTVEVFEVLDEVLQIAEKIDKSFSAHEKSLLTRTQKYIKVVIKKGPYLFGKTDQCPCASGEKIRNCCGRKLRHFLLADS